MGNPARANRWRAGGLVLALLVALVSAFAASAPASGASPDAGRRVMPLGDSITDGFNVPGGYRVDLWRKLVEGGRTVDFVGSMSNGPSSLGDRDHEGHSGWTIAQLDANVPAWLRAHSPRTILLHIGTNDIYGPDPAGAPARLSALVDKITAQAPDAILLVATITPLTNYDAGVRAFNATIPDMVRSKANAGKKVHLVDMHRALTTADLADGVHPNAGGYGKMATAWHDALLAIPGSVDDDGGTTTTTTPPPTGSCTATHRTVGSWQGGFQAEVTVTAGSAALSGWTVRWTQAQGQSITQAWGGVPQGSGMSAVVRNAEWNGSPGAGATTTFGYIGAGAATTPVLSCTSP
ncbi:GDSL-type esterase/lipase family protein [Actinosynnema mirum]|uniref:Cellulose-binding family II n=1 Tax=Actinosynnema mirum (strain ATCC 29888 / DSM 43827 / JCM 3225 / NBRC 14064 / NCIMB 13271 / NRRL B-12336 / IMRU 3971 / 101) TaxID=446462 RepID=C6WLG7_ACTMD|nr:GDSL-type esterase/lipase family protein [Actinosynnema mirum]ACU38360.1 cellulose-binding family II [Actinosynnema mirum DSM 43827]